jgi:serine/threonine protein kinase
MARRSIFQFKSVQLLKDQTLGIGTYGAVCKAKCDDLVCAAKILHPTLFDPIAHQQIAPQREHRLPIRRFEQECEFMSAIRHPNIVQYLGMFRDTDTRLPVLLMELMDDSLTHFLESSTQPIPYHIQVNICHDITLALSFLHSNNIVHRDLSGNNVLLIGNIRAKVTDFGMARLGDINPQATRFTSTMCPGTDVYMPPEAVQDKPVYTEKIDCFSFGVIIVQTLTRKFPRPGDRFQEVEFNHPGLPSGRVCVCVPEIDRRQNHISQVDPNHSLLPIALNCLKDQDSERLSAHQLCERIADLKGMPKYGDSARAVEDRDEAIRPQAIYMEEKASKEEKIQQLRQQLQQERDQANRKLEERVRQLQQESDQNLQETRRQLQEKEKQFGRVNQQLEASEQVVAQFERQIAELEQQLCQREQLKMKASSREKEPTSFKLTWREGKKMPYKRSRQSDAVVDGNTVYVKKGHTVNIYSYDVTSDSWSQLPDCIHKSDSILIINGWLTAIGGYSYPDYSNKLFSLTRKGSGRTWTEIFPPMPTKRKLTTSLCTGTALIVAGGQGECSKVLSTIEVMGTETHQWSTAADLPQPMYHASATICGDQLYMLGGISKDFDSIKSVYTCSVSTLLSPCVKNLQEERSSSVYKASVWEQVADLPVTRSTCESFHGRLLAIGGEMDSGKHSTAVHMYNSATNSWEIISHMTTGRCGCITAVLPDNQLVVVAGGVTDGGVIDVVELASVYVC